MEDPFSLADLVHQLNNFAIKRDLYQFHECFILATNDQKAEDVSFDDEFIRLYGEKIFSINIKSAFKIWQLFLDNFQYGKYELFKLFGMFLSHIKLLDGQNELNKASLEQLIQKTNELLCDFTIKDQHVLTIYHPLLCFIFLLKTFDNSDKTEKEVSPSLHDMSDLFEKTNSKQWQYFYEQFDVLQLNHQLPYVKMMVIKYRLTKLISGSHECMDSDGQLVEVLEKVTSNTGLIRCEILHAIIPQLNHQNLKYLLEHLVDSFVDSDSDEECQRQISQVFSLSSTWENGNFQTVFVTSLLKKIMSSVVCNKRKSSEDDTASPLSVILQNLVAKEKLWVKNATITPDSNNSKHEPILALIKTACATFLAASNESIELDVTKGRCLLKLVDLILTSVPLKHLQPLNQLRTILALSTLLVGLKLKGKEQAKFVDQFVAINQRIWDSIRSIWLFDFLPPSEYIYAMLCQLQSSLDNRCYVLFNFYIGNIFKLFDLEKSHQNVSTLVDVLSRNEGHVKVEYVFMVQSMILRNNAQFSKKLENNSKFASHVQQFEQIGANVSTLIYKNIKVYLESSDAFERLDSEFVVEGLTKLFEYKVFSSISQADEVNLKTKWRKLLTRFISISLDNLSSGNVNKSFVNFLQVVVQNRDKLQFTLSDNFVLDLWSKVALVIDMETLQEELNSKLSSSSHWRKVFEKAKVHRKFSQLYQECMESNKEHLSENIESYRSLLDTFRPLITSMAQSASAPEFTQMIVSCAEMLSQSSMARSGFAIQLLLQLLQAPLDSQKCRVLSDNFTTILSSLMNLLLLANKPEFKSEPQVQQHVRLGALKLTRDLLSRLTGAGLLSNSHLFLAYNLCAESGLVQCSSSSSDLSLFSDLFLALNDLLFDLNMRRPHLVIFSMCSQLNLLCTMLVSLLRSSDEANLVNATDQEKLSLEKCSKSFAHTLTQLCNEEDFKPYALHLIAHYLQHSPHYSVVYFVKKNLTAAIFNLVDLVKDKEAIERLYSRLNQGSREILKLLLEHYDKYHRFKGYV